MLKKIQEFLDNLLLYPLKFQIFLLFLVSLIVTLIGSFLITDQFKDFPEAFWWSLNHIIDAGNLADDEGVYQRLIGFIIALLGLAFFGLFISVLTAFLEKRLEELRKGKREVFVRNHIVILGWNEGIYTLLEELYLENPKNVVVLMSALSKEKVKEALDFYRKIKKVKFPKILIRTGDIGDINDLKRLNLNYCKKIIVLKTPQYKGDFSELSYRAWFEIGVIRPIYALLKLSKDFKNTVKVSFLIENSILEEIIRNLSTNKIKFYPVNYKEVLGNLIAFSSLYPELSNVYFELFSYKGNEIYIEPLNELKRKFKNFGELFESLQNAICIGLTKNNEVYLNPSYDTPLQEYECMIVLQNERGDYKITTFNRFDIKISKIDIDNSNKNIKEILCVGHGDIFEYTLKAINTLLGDSVKIHKEKSPKLSNSEMLGRYLKNLKEFLYERRQTIDTIIFVEETDRALEEENLHDIKILLQTSIVLEVFRGYPKKPNVIIELENPKNVAIAHAEVVVLSSKLANLLMVQSVMEPLREKIFSELLTIEGNELVILPVKFEKEALPFGVLKRILYREKQIIPLGVVEEGKIILNPKDNMLIKSGTKVILLGDFH